MTPAAAETIGLQALAWLVGDEELCPVFMGSTGASVDDLRVRANDPAFLGSVLEFLTMNDQWVMQFCDANELKYEMPLHARYALPGAQDVHWT
ncbi:DUF3572 domain-containing protein [Thalassobium sp. R2A62]|uniref:DUF3572 domain-containing protein n=1 Tax=Thalassobium sp. R2A62 TaxID=633131 RepID=UPI0001B1D4A5|nr:DUF3572 domain-containing protein [Thalassobium sp. R2A62]EET49099.1 hypothetical protein TR2A62_3642 [Thalassobium sp. R2A62]